VHATDLAGLVAKEVGWRVAGSDPEEVLARKSAPEMGSLPATQAVFRGVRFVLLKRAFIGSPVA